MDRSSNSIKCLWTGLPIVSSVYGTVSNSIKCIWTGLPKVSSVYGLVFKYHEVLMDRSYKSMKCFPRNQGPSEFPRCDLMTRKMVS